VLSPSFRSTVIRRRRAQRARARLAVALLPLLVATGAALPADARLVAGPAAHAYHCATRGGRATCACHPYDKESAIGHECHELGHEGKDSAGGPRQAECLAATGTKPSTDSGGPVELPAA